MRSTIWSVAPARLGPVPLDPHPVKNPDSPGFPTTAEEAIAFARFIHAARSERTPWRKIAEQLAISRIEAIRLAHSLDEVLQEIRDKAEAPPLHWPGITPPASAAEPIAS